MIEVYHGWIKQKISVIFARISANESLQSHFIDDDYFTSHFDKKIDFENSILSNEILAAMCFTNKKYTLIS